MRSLIAAYFGVLLISPCASADVLHWDQEGSNYAYFTFYIDAQPIAMLDPSVRETDLPELAPGNHLLVVAACTSESVCTPSEPLTYTVPEVPPPPKVCTDLDGNQLPLNSEPTINTRLRGDLVSNPDYQKMLAGGFTWTGRMYRTRANYYDIAFRCQL